MTPRVAIIVPAYKCETYIGATLTSIHQQSFKDWECIVVDDGSPDEAFEIADSIRQQDPRFRVIRQSNAGVAAARNVGLALVSPSVEFVTFMDSDDTYLPHAIEVLVRALDLQPDFVAAHALGDFIDECGEPLLPGVFASIGRNRLTCVGARLAEVPVNEPSTFANVVTSSTMFPPGLLLTRRHILSEVGGFDTMHVGAEDWDIYIRISRRGSIAFLNEVIVGYRRHQNNQGARSIVPEMCRRVYFKAFNSPENTPEQKMILRESWKAKQRDLGRHRFNEATAYVKRGRIGQAVLSLGRILIISIRYLRGYPTLGWL